MEGKRGTRKGEGLNKWTEKEENKKKKQKTKTKKKKEKRKKRGHESVTGVRERERGGINKVNSESE